MAVMDDWLRNNSTLARQRDATLTAAATALQGATKAMLMSVPIGTRVLDLITGEEGVVIDGRRENVVIPLTAKSGS